MPLDDMSEMTSAFPQAPSVQPVFVDVVFRREKGKCVMVIDAKGLHDYLARIGVDKTPGGQYHDGPPSSSSAITGTTVNTKALLMSDGPQVFNLMDYFSNCPSAEVMRALGDSVHDAAHKIVEHYRPIEISVIIHAKPGKV